MKKCERCGGMNPPQQDGAQKMLDYCAECSKDLCDECMAKGCCGHTPALSGMQDDFAS